MADRIAIIPRAPVTSNLNLHRDIYAYFTLAGASNPTVKSANISTVTRVNFDTGAVPGYRVTFVDNPKGLNGKVLVLECWGERVDGSVRSRGRGELVSTVALTSNQVDLTIFADTGPAYSNSVASGEVFLRIAVQGTVIGG